MTSPKKLQEDHTRHQTLHCLWRARLSIWSHMSRLCWHPLCPLQCRWTESVCLSLCMHCIQNYASGNCQWFNPWVFFCRHSEDSPAEDLYEESWCLYTAVKEEVQSLLLSIYSSLTRRGMTLHSQPCPLVCWFLKTLIVGLTESALDHIHAILESLQTLVTEVEDVAITIYSLPTYLQFTRWGWLLSNHTCT